MREDFHAVAVGAKHRGIEVCPAVVDKGVDDRFPVGIGVEQWHFLPLDNTVALVRLRDVQHIAEFECLIKGVKQAGVAEFADGVHRGCLVLAIEQNKSNVDSAVIGQQLRQQVILAVGHQETKVPLEGASVQSDALGGVIDDELVEGEVLPGCLRVGERRRPIAQYLKQLRLPFGVFRQNDLSPTQNDTTPRRSAGIVPYANANMNVYSE